MRTAKEKIANGRLTKITAKGLVLLIALAWGAMDAGAQQGGGKGKTPPAPSGGKDAATPALIPVKEIPRISEEGLVAKVGPGGVTKKELDFYLLRLANKSGKKVDALSPDEKKKALDEAVGDEIIFQAALASGALNDSYIRFMMSSLFRSNKTVANIRPEQFTDDDIKAYYDSHQKEFTEQPEVFVKAAKFSSKDEAQAFYRKAKSSPASASGWTDLGWASESKPCVVLPGALWPKVASLKKGQVTEPAQGEYSTFYVLFCSDAKEPRVIPFEEARGKVKFAMVNAKQKENQARLLKKMGFDPQKISEDDAMFFAALDAGYHREKSVRERCINTYMSKNNAQKDQLIQELKKKFPPTILQGAP